MMTRRSEAGLFLLLVAGLGGVCLISAICGPSGLWLGELEGTGILRLRLSRILLSVVAGAGLSVAGAIFQAILRNPLAEPYVLGISSGAALGAASAIMLGLSAVGCWAVPAAAFGGAMATIAAVYALAKQPGGDAPVQTLVLSGVIVGAFFGSLLLFLLAVNPSGELHGILWWLMGSLQVFDESLLFAVVASICAGLTLSVFWARELDLMTLGDEKAASLGLNVDRVRTQFFLLASLMTGATVASCGMIGFIGLMIPHCVRLAVGPGHQRLVPACAVGGAAFLVAADCFARTVIGPREIPVGVVTAMAGGPFFLVLLRRRNARAGV